MASQCHALHEWVRFEGREVHVSRFAHLKPSQRPDVYCPVCEEPVTPKLGPEVSHHWAHHPDSHCPARQAESAAHLNSKFHIADRLQIATGLTSLIRSPVLRVAVPCVYPELPGSTSTLRRCPAKRVNLFVEGWNEVRVERSLESVRPDILLLNNGVPQGAVEIRQAHSVSDGKAARLNDLGVPWVEVAADPAEFQPGGWTLDEPLLALRKHPRCNWICDHHRSFRT